MNKLTLTDQAPAPKFEVMPSSHQTVMPMDPMTAMIERVVLDPNASIEKLERMLAMKERLEDRALEERKREQQLAYHAAFSECQKEMKVVVKNKENKQTNSQYADLAALSEAVDPVIHKHGFSVSFQPAGTNAQGEQMIKWEIAHSGGHIKSDTASLPSDKTGAKGVVNKTDLHAFGSTATYGRRYLKLMLFDIATRDNDGNTAGKAPISAEQVAELDALLGTLEATEADRSAFCEWLKVETLADIPAAKFMIARKTLDDKRLARAKKATNGNR